MSHKCEVVNLLVVEQAISARGATGTLDESAFLIEADRFHADAGQLRGFTNVNDFRHKYRINPGVSSRVKKNSLHNWHSKPESVAFRFSSGTVWQYIGLAKCVFRMPSLRTASKGKVRRHLLQIGAFLLLLVCLCSHVAETFDFWDHTLQTGSDIEYSLVIVVLVAGAGFGLAHVAAVTMRAVSLTSHLLAAFVVSSSCAPAMTASPGYSPPQPLRI